MYLFYTVIDLKKKVFIRLKRLKQYVIPLQTEDLNKE